ncbi:MAG: hypothetical protein AAF204_04530 [Pseudomonadota bacterium]
MRFFILTFILLASPLSAHAACEGFNNALGALEHAVKKPAMTAQSSPKAVPPMAAINQAIDELELAIEKDRRLKRAEKTQSSKRL